MSYTIEHFPVLIDNNSNQALYLLAHDSEGTTVGLARVETDEANSLWIGSLFVQPLLRNQGIGTQLLQAVTAHAVETGRKFIWLAVHEDNFWAQHLYQKEGYSLFTSSEQPEYMKWIKAL